MKKIIYTILFAFLIGSVCFAQGTGIWKSYMAYHNTTAVAEAQNNVFAVANGSLYSYGKEDKSIRIYEKKDGELSDTQITHIGYNSEVKTLLIIYSNGNIDLLSEEGIYNISSLMKNINIQDKGINSINFNGKDAYLSAQFGILLLNMEKKEITDTYRFTNSVYGSCIYKEHLYAATSDGVRYGALSSNLLDANNWYPYELNFGSTQPDKVNIRQICNFSDVLCFFQQGQGIYYLQSSTNTLVPLTFNERIQNMKVENNRLLAFTNNSILVYHSIENKYTVNTGTLYDVSSLKNENTFWIASGNDGLKGFKRNGEQLESILSGTPINSPKRDLAAFMTFNNQRLFIAGGGRWTDRLYEPGTFMIYDTDSKEWTNYDETKIAQESKIKFSDVTSIVIDPQDNNHYFASTWGEGVFEFKDNEFVKLYNHTNTTLESASKSDPSHYIRVEGLTFDKDNNLWMTNSSVRSGLKVMMADGTWKSHYFSALDDQYVIDKILIRKNNHKWVNILRGENSGIFVFDENSDKTAQLYRTFPTRSTGDGVISANTYYCVVEDMKGQIWIGTNLGPIIIPSPDYALNDRDRLYADRIIHEENGISNIFLDGESVRAIAVDGGNRKWLGTQSSGVFVVSENGKEIIEHFYADEYPLPSDYIESIAIDPVTGEVFIGTDKGIVSYMGGATKGQESYSDVYAFPNPVRPEFQDMVTITGLKADSNIKITDVNGNLIIQGKSLGGQFTWDCRKKNGERVSTGVYLVLAHEPNQGDSVVTKIMVVK